MRIKLFIPFVICIGLCGCALITDMQNTDSGDSSTEYPPSSQSPVCIIPSMTVKEAETIDELISEDIIQKNTDSLPYLPFYFQNLPNFQRYDVHAIEFTQWYDPSTFQYEGEQSITISYHSNSCVKYSTDFILMYPGHIHIHAYYVPDGITKESFINWEYAQSGSNQAIFIRKDADRTHYAVINDYYCLGFSVSMFIEDNELLASQMLDYMLSIIPTLKTPNKLPTS